MKREGFGIKSMDSMIEGGLPSDSIVGLMGPPGVGKSIFSLHFLLEGARNGQKSLYVNLEEPMENIMRMINQFSFAKEFLNFVKKGTISIKCYTYSEFENIHEDLFKKVKEDKKIERLVVDSFNCFFMHLSNLDSFRMSNEQGNVRRVIANIFSTLRRKGLTSLIILEKNSSESVNCSIPYLVDGLIDLSFLDLGSIERRVFVQKMRWTNQFKESKDFEISNKGICIIDVD